jgi:hypothetical protein
MGGWHVNYPNEDVVVYHYDMPPQHISEITIMRNVLAIQLVPKAGTDDYNVQVCDAVCMNRQITVFLSLFLRGTFTTGDVGVEPCSN